MCLCDPHSLSLTTVFIAACIPSNWFFVILNSYLDNPLPADYPSADNCPDPASKPEDEEERTEARTSRGPNYECDCKFTCYFHIHTPVLFYVS